MSKVEYIYEEWPWGGYMVWKDIGFGELVDPIRVDNEQEAIEKVNELNNGSRN